MPFNPVKPITAARPRPTGRLHGLAAELERVACATTDPIARFDLNGIIHRVARMETTLDEMVAEAMAEARLPGEAVN